MSVFISGSNRGMEMSSIEFFFLVSLIDSPLLIPLGSSGVSEGEVAPELLSSLAQRLIVLLNTKEVLKYDCPDKTIGSVVIKGISGADLVSSFMSIVKDAQMSEVPLVWTRVSP